MTAYTRMKRFYPGPHLFPLGLSEKHFSKRSLVEDSFNDQDSTAHQWLTEFEWLFTLSPLKQSHLPPLYILF